MPTAIVADDEPRLAESLAQRLTGLWPQLQIEGIVTDGIAAAEIIAARRPDYAFLDIRMPGIDGIGVARIARDTRIIFVTAYDEYAVAAFDAAAADYLLKPVSDTRLAQCVARLRELDTAPQLDVNALSSLLSRKVARRLEWLTIRLGDTTRLVSVEEVLYFHSGDKYTEVITAAERHLIRTALKDLLDQLDPDHFAQIHRSIVVNLRCVHSINRDLLGRSRVRLHGREDTLPISRSYLDRFRQM